MAGAIAVVVAAAVATLAQTPAFWFGTWKLNVARSTYKPGPLPYKRATRRIASADGGAITIVDDLVRVRGGILHLEWTGKFDGVDYPVQGVEVALTNAISCRDERTCDVVQKVDGRIVTTEHIAISADGRTLTTSAASASGAGAALVYDRQ